MTLKKYFKQCKSFDNAYFQCRVELHSSRVFLNYYFDILGFLTNFCKIVHFQKGGNGPPISTTVG